MKRFLYLLCFVSLCFNIHGQNTFSGKIILKGNPCTTIPCLPCIVLWFETTDKDYVLSINSYWFCDNPLIVDGITYFVDDEVEITGIVSVHTDVYSNEYSNLEIETIKKLTSSIEVSSINKNMVYYDALKQSISIAETLQNQSLTFELIDLQGKVLLTKTNIGNMGINVVNLPRGVYLYRLLINNQVIDRGKILIAD